MSAGYRSLFGRWVGGFGAPKKKHIGWMPEWRFRHDPDELERRLKAQRESAFNPQWLDRFLKAADAARERIGEAKSAAHRAALEAATEQVWAGVSEAIEAGIAAPEALISALEAAVSARRASESIKHAERLASIYAEFIEQDEEDAVFLLLH